jgi:hypothetical protein
LRYFVEFYPDEDINENMIHVTHIWSEDEIYNKYIKIYPKLTKEEIIEAWIDCNWGVEL